MNIATPLHHRRSQPGRVVGLAQLAGDMDREYLVGVFRNVFVGLAESACGGLRSSWKLVCCYELLIEFVGAQVDSVLVPRISEINGQGHDSDVQFPADLGREVGGAVGNDSYAHVLPCP